MGGCSLIGKGFVTTGHRRFTRPDNGRFEYRIWPRLTHPAVSILHRSWPLVDAERRADIYLVHASSHRALVKLRDGDRLEIKRRGDCVGSVEYWTMPISAKFPLATAESDALTDALALPEALPADASLSPAHLLAALDARGRPVVPKVVSQTVRKSRLLFRSGLCRAEVCRVVAGGWARLTVALEAPDIPSIAAAIEELHLGVLPNRSYAEVLVNLADAQTDRRRLSSTIPCGDEGGG